MKNLSLLLPICIFFTLSGILKAEFTHSPPPVSPRGEVQDKTIFEEVRFKNNSGFRTISFSGRVAEDIFKKMKMLGAQEKRGNSNLTSANSFVESRDTRCNKAVHIARGERPSFTVFSCAVAQRDSAESFSGTEAEAIWSSLKEIESPRQVEGMYEISFKDSDYFLCHRKAVGTPAMESSEPVGPTFKCKIKAIPN